MLHKRMTRFAAVALCLSVLMAGCRSDVPNQDPGAGVKEPQGDLTQAFGPVDQKVQAGQGWVVLGPAQEGGLALAYLLPSGKGWSVAGLRQLIPEEAATATLKAEYDLVVVETKKENAPQYYAFMIGAEGLAPIDYYSRFAPEPQVQTGHFIMVNKHLNVLYHYNDGKLVKVYRVATGRQTEGPAATWSDYKTNFFTPEGAYTITNFVVNPPFNALKPGDQSFAGGAPGNPLGTRWMGFGVLEGDNAWIWGIHGTSHPELIGTWASDGCIRMFTEQAEELFDQIRGSNPALLIVGQ